MVKNKKNSDEREFDSKQVRHLERCMTRSWKQIEGFFEAGPEPGRILEYYKIVSRYRAYHLKYYQLTGKDYQPSQMVKQGYVNNISD